MELFEHYPMVDDVAEEAFPGIFIAMNGEPILEDMRAETLDLAQADLIETGGIEVLS